MKEKTLTVCLSLILLLISAAFAYLTDIIPYKYGTLSLITVMICVTTGLGGVIFLAISIYELYMYKGKDE